MVLNSLSFCLSVKLLISPSYLNEILAGYSNLGCWFFSFITLSMHRKKDINYCTRRYVIAGAKVCIRQIVSMLVVIITNTDSLLARLMCPD